MLAEWVKMEKTGDEQILRGTQISSGNGEQFI